MTEYSKVLNHFSLITRHYEPSKSFVISLQRLNISATSLPVRQLLNPPINLKENGLECVEYALSFRMNSIMIHAASALLPILDNLKSSPLRSSTIQYYPPAIEEGACYIKRITSGA
jgi:hypothetical protein